MIPPLDAFERRRQFAIAMRVAGYRHKDVARKLGVSFKRASGLVGEAIGRRRAAIAAGLPHAAEDLASVQDQILFAMITRKTRSRNTC